MARQDIFDKQITKFLSKAEKSPDGCWNWKGAKNPSGYGVSSKIKGASLAHRIAWMHKNGDVPLGPDGKTLYILHSCHNRACVNPDHLRPGTQQDNINDMVAAGRAAPATGVEHYRTKLNELQVRVIRHLASFKTLQYDEIGALFNVSKSAINNIKSGRTWPHVGMI